MDEIRVDEVEEREDFVRYVQYLRADLRKNKQEWENDNLDDFLEAMCAWISDVDGFQENNKNNGPLKPSWRLFAEILTASKYYE